jgi:competence protein ComFB
MGLHNFMEDIVSQYLEEILTQKIDICKCQQCREDMACYALNKVKPMYLVSSRGIIHTQNKKRLNYQDEIDVYSIVSESVNVVSKTKRHDEKYKNTVLNENETEDASYFSESGCYFNFPQIVGRILDSETLSSIDNVEISLNHLDSVQPIKMFNDKWKNPLKIVPQMEGVFSFWPSPEPSDKSGIQKDFQFNLKISKKGFENINRFIEIRLISSDALNRFVKTENIHMVEDIYLYPEGLGEDGDNV